MKSAKKYSPKYFHSRLPASGPIFPLHPPIVFRHVPVETNVATIATTLYIWSFRCMHSLVPVPCSISAPPFIFFRQKNLDRLTMAMRAFSSISVILTVLLAVSAASAQAEEEQKEHVLTLDHTNFTETVSKHKFIVVEFYAPWYICLHLYLQPLLWLCIFEFLFLYRINAIYFSLDLI